MNRLTCLLWVSVWAVALVGCEKPSNPPQATQAPPAPVVEPPPAAVERLISLRELQLLADAWGIVAMRFEDRYTLFDYTDPQRIHDLATNVGSDLRVADRRNAYLVMPHEMEDEELLRHLQGVLG